MRKRDLAVGGILLAAAVLVIVRPEHLEALPSLCVFRAAFGWECPGCGMTRALSSLAQGDFYRAISYNWKVVIVGPLLALLALRELRSAVEDRS